MRTATRAILTGVLAALLVSPVLGAPTQEELKERRAALVAEDWFTDAGWIDDYDKARAEAKDTGKLIFAYFSRSYAT